MHCSCILKRVSLFVLFSCILPICVNDRSSNQQEQISACNIIYWSFAKSKFQDIYLSTSFHRHPNKRRYIPDDLKIVVNSILSRALSLSLACANATRGPQKNQLNGLCEISAQLRTIAKSSRAIDGRIIKRSRSAVSISAAILSRAPSAFHRACAFLLRDSEAYYRARWSVHESRESHARSFSTEANQERLQNRWSIMRFTIDRYMLWRFISMALEELSALPWITLPRV